MVNNYCQFSFVVPLSTDEERDWAREALEITRIYVEGEFERPTGEFANLNLSAWKDADALEIGFSYDFEDGNLCIYVEESGSPELAAAFVQVFLQKFAPDQSCGFEYAFICSRSVPGAFGGGAAFVTANEIRYMNTWNWLRKQGA